MDDILVSFELDRLTLILIAAAAIVFAALGWAAAWYRQQRHVDRLQAELSAQQQYLHHYADGLEHRFASLSNNALQKNSETFLQLAKLNFSRFQTQTKNDSERTEQQLQHLLTPLQQALVQSDEQLKAFERQRHTSFAALSQQLRQLDENQQQLGKATDDLGRALRRPEVRGRWGESTLRRLLELSGMSEHADFSEQPVADSALRPDVIVHLSNERDIIIDAKTPMDAFLDSLESEDNSTRKAALKRHAGQVRTQMNKLADKAYWQQFDRAIDFVVLFLPGDPFLTAALEVDPGLLDDACASRVMIATPTSLVALLRAVAFAWRQDTLAANAREIQRTGQQVVHALETLSGQVGGLGKGLDNAVNEYNRLLRALESRVFPALAELAEMGIDTSTTNRKPATIRRKIVSHHPAANGDEPATLMPTKGAHHYGATPVESTQSIETK